MGFLWKNDFCVLCLSDAKTSVAAAMQQIDQPTSGVSMLMLAATNMLFSDTNDAHACDPRNSPMDDDQKDDDQKDDNNRQMEERDMENRIIWSCSNYEKRAEEAAEHIKRRRMLHPTAPATPTPRPRLNVHAHAV